MKQEKWVAKNHRVKRQKEIAERVKTLDDELLSFYEFCEKMGFTAEEMDTICAPLNEVWTRSVLTRIGRGVLFLILILGMVYGASQLTPVTTHSSAIGRIALIKLLSLWDWRYIFIEPCLVENPFYGEYGITSEDCLTCEALDSINFISRANYKQLTENYLNRDAPVIITDATDNWDVMNGPLQFENITELYIDDPKLAFNVPCVLTTNLRQGGPDLSFLKFINSPSMKKWFVHWQNCDIQAVKTLRKFYQKPYFLPDTISPAHYNWVLMSSEYTSKTYRRLELDSGLIMMIQLRGSILIRLLPYKPCNESCPVLNAVLHQGEILVLKNYLWILEYLPGKGTENIGILTETAWDQSSV